MTNDAERTSMSRPKPELAKQYHNKNVTRLADESVNPCLKVTLVLLVLVLVLVLLWTSVG